LANALDLAFNIAIVIVTYRL